VLPAVESAPVTDALPADGAPRVLVVGADANEVRVLSEEVSRLGVAATPAQPASALPLVSDPALFHVLVVEHELGGSTGWDLARQARAARDDLRIVLLTEPAHAVSETQARNAGIDGVLVRPFDAREVHAEVFAVLAAPRGRRSARPAADADSGRTLRNAEVT
jgi:DNA-binding response OmpR family regulator